MADLHCNIIKDLLPLVVDDVASLESCTAVEQHLKTCPDCAAEMAALRQNLSIPAQNDAAVFKKIKWKQYRKQLFALVLGLLLLAIWLWPHPVDVFTEEERLFISCNRSETEAKGFVFRTWTLEPDTGEYKTVLALLGQYRYYFSYRDTPISFFRDNDGTRNHQYNISFYNGEHWLNITNDGQFWLDEIIWRMPSSDAERLIEEALALLSNVPPTNVYD